MGYGPRQQELPRYLQQYQARAPKKGDDTEELDEEDERILDVAWDKVTAQDEEKHDQGKESNYRR